MKQQTKVLSAYKRKLHIDGEEWSYRITSRTVEICNPSRTKKFKYFTNQSDLSPHDHDCDCSWCYEIGSWSKAIKPSQVAKLIQAKILGTIKAWTKQLGTIDSPVRL